MLRGLHGHEWTSRHHRRSRITETTVNHRLSVPTSSRKETKGDGCGMRRKEDGEWEKEKGDERGEATGEEGRISGGKRRGYRIPEWTGVPEWTTKWVAVQPTAAWPTSSLLSPFLHGEQARNHWLSSEFATTPRWNSPQERNITAKTETARDAN